MQGGRKGHRQLPRRAPLAVLAVRRPRDRHFRAGGELRRDGVCRAHLEVERFRVRRRERNDPIRAELAVIHEIAPLDGDMVAIDRNEHPFLAAELIHDRHLLQVVQRMRAGVFAAVDRVDVAQRCRADRRESPLPDAAFVGERMVGMSGKGYGIRKLRQRAPDGSVIAPPSPRAMARILRVRMLDVEEGRVSPKLGRVLFHVGFDGGYAFPSVPVRTDERVALDGLLPDGRIRFLEHAFPCGGAVGGDGVFRFRIFGPPDIMVAVDEQLLDRLSAQPLAVRERLLPRIGHMLQLRDEPLVGHVARDHHAIDALVAKPRERLEKCFRSIRTRRLAHMHVAHHAESQARHRIMRRHVQRDWLRQAVRREHPPRLHRHKCQRTVQKHFPGHKGSLLSRQMFMSGFPARPKQSRGVTVKRIGRSRGRSVAERRHSPGRLAHSSG